MADEQETSATAEPADSTATETKQVDASSQETTATADTPKAEQQKTVDPADWRAGIEDPKLRDWANRWASPADVVKSNFEMRQKLSNAVIPPGKDATDEDRAAYLKRIGVPEGDYPWQMVDGRQPTDYDKQFQTEAGKVFKDLQISSDQAKGLNAFWNTLEKQANERAVKDRDDHQAEQEAALRKEWGPDYEPNASIASQTWLKFGGDEAVEDLKLEGGKRLGDHPALMKMFARIGRQMSESPSLIGMSDTDVQSLEEKRLELVRQSIEAGARGDKQAQQRAHREAIAIAERLYGKGPPQAA